MIDLSLNEVETLATKAARGAGFAWGLAEDIGRAARALAVAGMPWAEALVSLAGDAATLSPPADDTALGGAIRPVVYGACLCPVHTGAMLLDSGASATGAPIRFERLAHPVWLVGLLTLSRNPRSLAISWPGALAFVHESIVAPSTGSDWLTPVADVMVAADAMARPAPTANRRSSITPDVLAALEIFAAQTYVPATEQSRARGAGGERTDDE